MLRYRADLRSVFFMFLTTFLLVILWQQGFEMSWWLFAPLYTLQLIMAVTVSVMTHNHQHLSMWKNKWMNVMTDNWLTMFYGFPIFAWIPTHLTNHHIHINTEEDYTKTYRYSEKNNLLTLLTYPTISGMFQQKPVKDYFLEKWHSDRPRFYLNALQVVCLIVFTGGLLLLDWRKALIFVILPQQLSLFSVLIFNYVQHVHADEETEYNNARNITGWLLNFVLLNNGLHTAHHLFPGYHWSRLRAKHEEIEHKIHPSLNEKSFFWYLFRNYILGIFIPSCRTQSMRIARKENRPIAHL